MTRNDRLIDFEEICSLVVTCKKCGAEIHVPIKHGYRIAENCPVCNARILGAEVKSVEDIVNLLSDARQELPSIKVNIRVPA